MSKITSVYKKENQNKKEKVSYSDALQLTRYEIGTFYGTDD
jgi:Neuraminidase (sialidase)